MGLMGKCCATAVVVAGMMALTAPAHAAFVLTNSGDTGANGSVVTSPTGFDLFGTDTTPVGGSPLDGVYGNYLTTYLGTANAAETFTLTYTYTTSDATGDSVYDPAGFYLNGVFTKLSVDGSAGATGTLTETLAAGDVYGFYVGSTGILGGANILVTGVPAADLGATTPGVPEPASWAMMITGFGLVGGTLRSRRMSRAIA